MFHMGTASSAAYVITAIGITIIAQATLSRPTVSQSVVSHRTDLETAPDWSSFILEQTVNPRESCSLLRSVPVRRFWDGGKGRYRSGLLVDEVQAWNESYVTVVETLHGPRGERLQSPVAVSHVDYQKIFLHLIGCVQHLYDLHSTIDRQARSLSEVITATGSNLTAIRGQYFSADYQSSIERALRNDILEITLKTIYVRKQLESSRYQARRELWMNKSRAVRANRDAADRRSHEILKQHRRNSARLSDEYYHDFIAFEKEKLQAELEAESEFMKQELEMETALLSQELVVFSRTIAYRLQEETRIAKLNEPYRKKLVQLQYVYRLQSMRTIVSVLFDELAVLWKDGLASQPERLAAVGLMIVVLALLSVLFFQVTALVYDIYYRSQVLNKVALKVYWRSTSQRSWLRFREMKLQNRMKHAEDQLTETMVSSSPSSSSPSQHDPLLLLVLPLSSLTNESDIEGTITRLETRASVASSKSTFFLSSADTLRHLYETIQLSNRTDVAALPNVLVLGSNGLGKSSLLTFLSTVCTATHIVIRGADLLALGWQESAQHLRKVIEYMTLRVRSAAPGIIFLDDVDELIVSRAACASSHACFYVLLEAMRQPNSRLSFVLTSLSSSSPLSTALIDEAILDRMDSVIQLQLPGLQERCNFVLLQAVETLVGVLAPADFQSLRELQEAPSDPDSSYRLLLRQASAMEEESNVYWLSTREALMKHLQSCSDSDINNGESGLDLIQCLCATAVYTRSRSYRDIAKILSSVRSEALSQQHCVVTTSLWLREVFRAVDGWEELAL